jgi:hypothetical protein
MRALASLGLLEQLDEDRFALTPAGRLLCAGEEGSVRGMALHWGERLWGALSQLDQSIETGKAWSVSGLEGFQHMARDPVQLAMFHQSMADQTAPAARALLQTYDVSRYRTLMDVGGSYGALLAAILAARPELSGVVFDLPDLAAASGSYLEIAGVSDRARFVGGNFFESVPSGCDGYMLKMIIHDWPDEEAVAILANCRKAAGAKGRVLVMERIAPELASTDADAQVPIRQDIIMLTAAGGLERTEAQYRTLFARAGLKLDAIVPTSSGFSVLEAASA